MRALRGVLAVLVYGALGLLALAGLALSALALYASLPGGREVVAARLVRIADEAVAGRLELAAVEVLPRGGIAVRGFRAYDPEGRLVLDVDRARVTLDVTRLRNKVIGLTAELEGGSVLVEEGDDGSLSLLRAFAPAHPSPPAPPKPGADLLDTGGWTVRLSRLSVRGTDVWWQDRRGDTRLEAHDLSLEARAVVGPRRARAELKLAGEGVAPLAGPLALDLRALLDGDAVRVPVLRATLGGTALSGLGEGDLRRRTGRFALLRAGVDRGEARQLVNAVPPGQDLALDAYAESDGAVATAAVHVAPRAAGAGGGDAAVAGRLDGTPALGLDVATDALDPSALHAQAPPGRVTVKAHGGFAGADLATLRGRLALALAPSRLREGTLGPVEASARLDRGSWDVQRLIAVAPGLRVEGAGRWQQGGAVAGRLSADALDLAAAARNLSALLATRLPPAAGRVHAEVTAAGTAAAPVLTAAVSAPSVQVDGVAAAGLRAAVTARGPFRPGQLQLDAQADHLASGGRPVARALSLKASVDPPAPGAPSGGAKGRLEATALVADLGKDPVVVSAAGALAVDRASLRLDALALGYPGTRYELEEPATVTLAGPSVDRLALRAGPQRLVVEGGLAGRELAAHVVVEALDLARLPAGLLPADEGLAGRVSADVRASGPPARPRLAGHLALADGAFRDERGLALDGDVRWDLGARRAQAKATVTQAGAPRVAVDVDLPVPLAGRPGEALSATVGLDGLPLEELLAAGRRDGAGDAPVRGRLSARARLRGTVGAPALHLEATVADGAVQELTGVGVQASAEVERRATVRGEATLDGATAARLTGELPLDLAGVLARPGPALRALRDARLAGALEVPGLELAALSGKLGVPPELAGRVAGTAQLSGRVAAPRGAAAFTLQDGAFRGYRALSGRLSLEARDDAVSARGELRLGEQRALVVDGALRAPVERLETAEGLRAAALTLDATVPRLALAQASGGASVALSGVVEARAQVRGSLARPAVELQASGTGVAVEGRPLGDARVSARAGGDALAADLLLAPSAGGELRATLKATVPITADLTGEALARAPAVATLRASRVSLGFLPVVAPGVVRAAGGALEADLTAQGPLAALWPRGTVRLDDGRVAVVEYGDWTGIALDGVVTDDAVELRRLEARRGKGKVRASGALRGLAGGAAKLEGKLTTENLTVARAGMDVVTLTNLELAASGGYQAQTRTLDVRLDVSPTTLRLPDKLPRELQSLERRSDIIVGKRPPRKERGGAPAAPARKPFVLRTRVVAPGRLRVVQANPRVDLELKADVTYERSGASDYLSGAVQTVRGEVVPLAGRRFDVRRGRVTFTGGPPQAALVDVEAVWENPTATVTANVSGPLTRPQVKLTSTPALDESQIAMLIATGGTELKAGGGANVSGLQDASKIGFAVFNTLIRDRLPIDTNITIDANAQGARIGYYLPGTSVYVGLIRRFDVSATDVNVNETEVTMQYAISPRWTLEGRWGRSAGGAASNGAGSLIWSKDY